MNPDPRTWFDIVVLAAAGVLLLSMGGAIVATPVTTPLMIRAARRHPGRAWRPPAALLGAATLAEVAWAATYLTVGESRPWIWLLPLATASITASAILRMPRPATPQRPGVGGQLNSRG